MSISVVFTKLFRSVDYEKKERKKKKKKKKNFLILSYLFDLLSTRSLIGCQASLTFIGSVSRVLCYLKRNDWTFHQVDLFDTSWQDQRQRFRRPTCAIPQHNQKTFFYCLNFRYGTRPKNFFSFLPSLSFHPVNPAKLEWKPKFLLLSTINIESINSEIVWN